MLPLGTNYIAAKNKMTGEHAWIMLLQINIGETILRLCANTEDIEWNGETWTAFPFTMDIIKDATKEEVPQVVVRVGNVNQAVQYHVEMGNGGIGSLVTVYVVYTGDLPEVIYVPTFEFEVVGCKCDATWATFTLGASSPYRRKDPSDRMLKNFCRYSFPNIIDLRCPYTGTEFTSCNKTLSDCRERNGDNSRYYGGFPSMGSYAIYV